MFKSIRLILSSVVLVSTLPAMAEDMKCGNQYIEGDQIEPLLKEQVVEKCGEPTSKEGDHWYYESQGKILVFNSDGLLMSVQDAAKD